MSNPNMAYHLTMTLDGWFNSRMESVYSWNIIFPSRKVILLRADNLSEVSHTGKICQVHDACLQHHNGFCDGASTCTKPHQASASTGHLFQSQSSAFGFSQEACP
ncbi:TPA: hypothetical protein ACH3X1_014775 [Trebouxia sp. C0004]